MKRMFHPTLDSYVDVPDDSVEAWKAEGWLKTQPKHVHIPADAPKPGEHPGLVSVPVLEAPSDTTSSTVTGTAPTT